MGAEYYKSMRKVILHYHLFKNAGTSVDAALKENVAPEEWVTREFPLQPNVNREQVSEWILNNIQARIFSSHTAYLPPPKLEGVKVLPVIFIRHPIDRIASAYAFEARQTGDSFGAVLARNTNLSGYIQVRLAIPNDHQCRNFHIHRLSMMFDKSYGGALTRAKMALTALPFVGIVERFDWSLMRLESWLQSEGFDGLRLRPIRKNVSRPISELQDRLRKIERELGETIYRRLIEENEDDLILYEEAVANAEKIAGDAS